jgi:propanol-preferring alcohol dehydrogenase
MRALILKEPGGPLLLEDVPLPQPGPFEVLVRVRACGLGLTLVWNRNGRGSGDGGAGDKLPRIIGHEIAGDVVECGAHVRNFQPEDRVNVYYYLTCGDCRWCNVGREDLCDSHTGYVGRQIDGGLAEYVKLPARNLCHIPAEVSYMDAAITADAIATPVHVLRERAQVKSPETVLIVGAGGGVGIHMVQMAKVLGARVIAVDITAEKLALAREMGADEVINSREADFAVEARHMTHGRGVDVVVEMVGLSETLDASLRSVGKGGRIVFVGSYDQRAVLPLNPRSLNGEIVLTGSRYCTRQQLAEAVELVAQGRIRPVINRVCKLEEADEVLRSIERMELAGRACAMLP